MRLRFLEGVGGSATLSIPRAGAAHRRITLCTPGVPPQCPRPANSGAAGSSKQALPPTDPPTWLSAKVLSLMRRMMLLKIVPWPVGSSSRIPPEEKESRREAEGQRRAAGQSDRSAAAQRAQRLAGSSWDTCWEKQGDFRRLGRPGLPTAAACTMHPEQQGSRAAPVTPPPNRRQRTQHDVSMDHLVQQRFLQVARGPQLRRGKGAATGRRYFRRPGGASWRSAAEAGAEGRESKQQAPV